MISSFFLTVSSLIINGISFLGYPGIIFLMALESACIPVPSEIIMPFSGYLVFSGQFSLWWVVICGTVGNLLGSIIAYFVGFYGGRALIEKYGKYIFISEHDLDLAQKWFEKYGDFSIFFSRMLPVVRTFISLPAGISRMPFWKFSFYTLAGSLPWSFGLAWAGVVMGENWSNLEFYFQKFDWLIITLIVLGIAFWLYRKLKHKK